MRVENKRFIIVHKTLASCLEAYGVRGAGSWEWRDADGRTYKMPLAEMKRRRRKSGCWAWIADKSTIHIWVGKNCTRRELFRVLAHEMGHTERPHHRTLTEEQKAAKYERVALSAYDYLGRVWHKAKAS